MIEYDPGCLSVNNVKFDLTLVLQDVGANMQCVVLGVVVSEVCRNNFKRIDQS